MIKDPFSKIPDLVHEDTSDQEIELPEISEPISKGNSPKGVLTKISSAMIPVAGICVFAWLFWPAPEINRSADAKNNIDLVQDNQGNNTSALISQLKEDADINAKPPTTAKPQEYASTPDKKSSGTSPVSTVDLEKLALEAKKREEDIRSSPLEAGQLKLLNEQLAAGTIDRTKAFLDDATSEFQAKRDAADSYQSSQTEKLLQAMKPKEEGGRRNTQDEEFLNAKSSSTDYKVTRQQQPITNTLISQGTVVRSVLLTGINNNMPGSISAQVTADVYDSINQRYILIPKGSKLHGLYNSQVVPGQDRLLVAMTRLVRPDGSWIALNGATGADTIGQSGLTAEVDNHFFKMFGTSLIIGASSFFLGGRDTTSSTNGADGSKTFTGSILGVALNETVRNLMERNRRISPTLTKQPGDEFLFLVANDLVMTPYKR